MTTTPTSPAASQQAVVDAALLVLKSMSLSLDALLSALSNRPPVPTFAELSCPPRLPPLPCGRGSYWKRTVEQWGDRRLNEPTPSEVKQLVPWTVDRVCTALDNAYRRVVANHL